MYTPEQIDVLDLLIHCIKDHENKASDTIQLIDNLQYIKQQTNTNHRHTHQ